MIDFVTIGFSITEDFYANHELSRTRYVNDIACLNDEWSNVVYLVSTQDVCPAADCKDSAICLVDAPPYDHICNCEDYYGYEGMCTVLILVDICSPGLHLKGGHLPFLEKLLPPDFYLYRSKIARFPCSCN